MPLLNDPPKPSQHSPTVNGPCEPKHWEVRRKHITDGPKGAAPGGTTSGLSQISNAEGAESLSEITLSETVRKTKCDAARRLNLGSCETMTLPLARGALPFHSVNSVNFVN
jgi:hypothetical protein